jgi:hypothetical protein
LGSGLVLHFSNAAENEERDPPDGQPEPFGDKRVRKLMEHDRAKETERTGNPHPPVGCIRKVFIMTRENAFG